MWYENETWRRLKQALATVCLLFAAGMAIRSVALAGAAMARNDPPGVITNMIGCMPWGVLAGLLFVRLYLGTMIEHALDSLLAPRRFRDRPAPLVSPVKALVKQERYEEALNRLDVLIEADPDLPELRIMRFDLLCEQFQNPEEALRTAEQYLFRPGRIRSADNARLVLRYAGQARKLGRRDDAATMLRAELKRFLSGYSRAERKLLQNMLDSLEHEAGPPESRPVD